MTDRTLQIGLAVQGKWSRYDETLHLSDLIFAGLRPCEEAYFESTEEHWQAVEDFDCAVKLRLLRKVPSHIEVTR